MNTPVAIGFIGLGVMGSPMARYMLNGLPAGSSVNVTDRFREKVESHIQAGATWHDHARGVGEASDIVFLMVPDLPDVEAVLGGADGLAAGLLTREGNTIVVVSSTVSPTGIAELDKKVRKETGDRIRFVDAPVSGGQEGAEAGKLSIFVGGDAEDVERVLPILSYCGTPVHLGPIGCGEIAKACNQMIVAATVEALGEAAVIAERSGMDLDAMFTLIAGGYAASRILDVKKDRFVHHDHSPSGPAKFMIKDLTFAKDVAQATNTATPVTDILKDMFTELTNEGMGDNDTAVIQRYIEGLKREG
ncbi:NAD(P)-dependent oxidoreductase [Arcanobacterium haemolyticum]|nr:NAD(P)-dependent oxidoreductase [Arcanobacterium haemolyticum]